MTTEREPGDLRQGVVVLGLLRMLVWTMLPLFVLFGAAGTTVWPLAWLLFIYVTSFTLVSRLLLWQRFPGLILERAKGVAAEGGKWWDKLLAPLLALFGPIAIYLIAGLDFRYGWTEPLPGWLSWLALGLLMSGYLFGGWAMLVNRYFAAVVRVQTERHHQVVTTGPYRYLRHPSYAGAVVVFLALPIVLSSWWAYVPAGCLVLLTILRTYLEDQTLQAELADYQAYAAVTRYRLIPFVW